jgi:hypothetical protein
VWHGGRWRGSRRRGGMPAAQHRPGPSPSHMPPQEAKNGGASAAEAREIALYGGVVVDGKRMFINKLDGSLAGLKECECVIDALASGVDLRGRRRPRLRVAPASDSPSRPQEAVALHQQH